VRRCFAKEFVMLLLPHEMPRRRERRAGFTLIELLIVITIIGILMSLLAVAVMRILLKGPEVQTGVEIGQLATAIETFKSRYNVQFIPSKITLDETGAYTNGAGGVATALDTFSKQYLRKLWPRINFAGIDWNGNGTTTDIVTLEGEECLVFFLGGIPASSGGLFTTTGFSNDPTNPANPSSTVTRQPNFYEFKAARLVDLRSTGFLSYTDAYLTNMPFLYFSSYTAGNDYNTSPTDCPSYATVAPYQDPTSTATTLRFLNPKGYQILSAGRDGVFGAGGTTWNPITGYPASNPGADDQSNFSKSLLGVIQN
jgi:general secretion pathway protein G